MKSSFGNSHRKRNKEKSKRKSREKEEALQADVQQQMEHYLASFESNPSCCELPVEEVVRDEPESIVEVKKTQALEVSLLNETRREHASFGALLCNCEGCVKVSQDQGLEELLGLGMGQVVTMGCDKKRGSSSLHDGGNGSYITQCSEFPDLLFYNNLCFSDKLTIIRGKIYDLLTPHFHYYMLLRLVVGLDNMVTVMGLLIWRCDLSCINLSKLSIVKTWLFFVLKKCYRHDCWDFNILDVALSRIVLFRMLLLIWKVINKVEMKQETYFCFILDCGSNIGMNHVENSLTCWHLNKVLVKHCLCIWEGLLIKKEHKEPIKLMLDNRKHLEELIAPFMVVHLHLRLSVDVWALHMSGLFMFVSMNGLKPASALKERDMSCIKVKHKVCRHGLRAQLNATQHSDFYYALVSITREFGCHVHCATLVRPRNFIVIFDPGGVCVKPSLGAAFEHESA